MASPTNAAHNPPPAANPAVHTISRRAAIGIRLAGWSIFGVIFGLLPLLVTGVTTGMSPSGFSLDDILGKGELFIASAAIAGGAIGELLAAAASRDLVAGSTWAKVGAVVLGGAAAIAVVVNTIGFMTTADLQVKIDTSWRFFFAALVPSGLIVAMVAK